LDHQPALDPPWPSPGRSGYALALLFVAYAFAFVDRTILTLLVAPIRSDLSISDTQVSLLHGFAFAIFYTFVGIPVARYADTGSRRAIISLSALAWSFACAACGLARNFPQLFLGRIGVGIGEAGLSPAAYSMIADLFPPRRLGLAMSIFVSALYIGAGMSLIIGGSVIGATSKLPPLVLPWVGLVRPWQITFFVVGLPGFFISLAMLTVKEPARRDLSARPAARSAPPLRDAFRFMAGHARAYAGYIGGFTLIAVIYNVAVAWGPTYLMRTMQVGAPDAGRVLGFTVLLAGAGGAVFGGLLTDAFRRRGLADAAVRVGLLSALGTAPTGALAFLGHSRTRFEWLFALMLFAASMAFGAAAAGLQTLTPNRMRAQASAAYLFALNLLAVGVGPTAAAMLTDFWFKDDLRVGQSVSLVICVAAPLAVVALMMARKPFIACAALNGGPGAQLQESTV
jgi:MFS family permease